MTALNTAHFLHVVAFALVLGLDLPAFYAAKRASVTAATSEMRLLAARVVRWSGTLSSLALALLLPLGITIGAALGAYRVTNETWLIATWLISGLWVALIILAEALDSNGLGGRLYTLEIWVRWIIGLGNLYDGVNAMLGGRSPIQAPWLALKVALLGLALIASAVARQRLRPVRAAFAELNPMSAQSSSWDTSTSETVAAALKRARPMTHAILLFVLVAAWMGVTKSWQ